MDIFRQAKTELDCAKRAIDSMKSAKSFSQFEDAWKTYLTSIEKCWIKVERACQHKKNEFQPWQGEYTSLRKKDPLLCFIKHARNADHHTLQEMVKHIPGGTGLKFPGGKGFIKSLKIDRGVITEYIGDPMIVENFPSRIELLKITDSGVSYDPPTHHLGEKLISNDPISVAEKGVEFYVNFLNEAEAKFAK